MTKTPLKLAIFNDGQLPLPSVKGGSVPTLIEMILNENEIHHDFDVDVFSCFDSKARMKAKAYKYSAFYYSRSFRMIRFFTNISFKTKLRLVNLKSVPLPHKFKYIIKNKHYDVVLISGYIRGALTILKKVNCDSLKIVAHHTVTDLLHESSIDGKQIYKYADIITFDSEYAAKYASTGNAEQNKKNYAHQDSIPDLSKYCQNSTKNREDIRGKYKLSSDDFVILFCGRFVEYKGIYELITAFNDISPLYPKIKLLLCGSNTYSGKINNRSLNKLLRMMRDNQNIVLTGFVNYENIYKIYQACDATALVTKIDEAFGMVGIESLAAGKPLITTRTGGIAEYADDTNSFFVRKDNNMVSDIKEAIVYCAEHPNSAAKLGENGRKKVSKYNQENYYKRFREIIFANVK